MGSRVSDARLREIAEMAAARPEGKWTVYEEVPSGTFDVRRSPESDYFLCMSVTEAEADLVAAAGTDMAGLVADLQDARALLQEWLGYTGLRARAFDADLNPDDDEYASGRSLVTRTDAVLAGREPTT